MARRRADQVVPGLDTRDALWAAIRQRRHNFTVREIAEETRLGKHTAYDYINGLTAAGYLARAEAPRTTERSLPPVVGSATLTPPARRPGYKTAHVYDLVRDAGPEAPRVRKDGTEVTQGRGREQLWRTIPILKEFSARELALAASIEEHTVSEADARHYCHYLARAGLLARTGAGRFRHLPSRRPGPLPPQIQRVRRVWDPNDRKVLWPTGGDT